MVIDVGGNSQFHQNNILLIGANSLYTITIVTIIIRIILLPFAYSHHFLGGDWNRETIIIVPGELGNKTWQRKLVVVPLITATNITIMVFTSVINYYQ